MNVSPAHELSSRLLCKEPRVTILILREEGLQRKTFFSQTRQLKLAIRPDGSTGPTAMAASPWYC